MPAGPDDQAQRRELKCNESSFAAAWLIVDASTQELRGRAMFALSEGRPALAFCTNARPQPDADRGTLGAGVRVGCRNSPFCAADGGPGGSAMKTSEITEIAWAVLDARAVAKLLDRLTPKECALPPRELCLVRAHAWALVDGLQSLLAELPKVSTGEHESVRASAPAPDRVSQQDAR